MIRRKTTITIVSLILLLTLGLVLGYFVLKEKTVQSNISFMEKSMGGLNYPLAYKVVEEKLQRYRNNPIRLTVKNGDSKQFLPEDLGVYYDSAKTTDQLFSDSSLIAQLFNSAAKAQEKFINPIVKVDSDILRKRISEFLETQTTKPSNASISWSQGSWTISTDQSGVRVKDGEIERVMESLMISNLDEGERVYQLEFEEWSAERNKDDLKALIEKLNRIDKEMVVLQLEGDEDDTFRFSDDEDWLDIDEESGAVKINEKKLEKWVEGYVGDHNIEAGVLIVKGWDEKSSEYDGKAFKKAVTEGHLEKGRALNEDDLKESIRLLVLDSNLSREIDVKYEVVEPSVESQIDGITFPDLLSTGRSSFQLGNYADRVVNIHKRMNAFRSVIVAPGEEFSMNRATGWITEGKGYKKTEIIAGNQVVAGVGGGVCQTSTTLFRAVVNAGLELGERRSHSLDVEYYHEDGYGIDAAVYTAARGDFSFKNDTENHLLINTFTTNDDYAVVEFYGISDGREVELENIETGNRRYKKWKWNVIRSGEVDERVIESRYVR